MMVRDVTADGPPFRIDRDGVWWHGDVRIERIALVKLFASILVREADGSYWISNPAERAQVTVDDVPYVINANRIADEGIVFTTSLGEDITLDTGHPLTMKDGVPYVMVRSGCAGRVATRVYYDLVRQAETRDGQLFLRSAGTEFCLGAVG